MRRASEMTVTAGRPTTDPRPRRAFDGPAAGPFTELSARRLGPVRRFFLRRPVVMDVVVLLWFGVPALLEAVLNESGSRRGALVVFAVAGSGVLAWRRRRPLPVAVGMTLLGVGQTAVTGSMSGYDLGIALAVYAVAASRAPRDAWLTVVASGGALSAAALLWERPTPQGATASMWTGSDAPHETVLDLRVASITGVVLLLLVAISIGISVHNRRVHVADLVDRGNQLAREHDQQAQLAVAAERARIAREMHDVVAHSLSVMVALADGAGVALARDPERSRHALDEVAATGRTALADMRRVLGVLTEESAPLGPQPGGPELAALVDGFRTAGLPVEVVTSGGPLPPDAGLQLAVYRIVQESLTNTLRYATGTGQVEVRITSGPEHVTVDVTDDGGVNRPTMPIGTGRGVIGMRERAAVYGGIVEAGPYRRGWRVHAELRWQET